MPVMWLSPHEVFFPHPDTFDTPDVVAVGGDLSPNRLLLAYSLGIFPWFNENEPLMWWSPDPRMVLFPNELTVHKSMRPYFNQKKFDLTFNTCFQDVMRNCRDNDRKGQFGGSWITETLIEGFTDLHHRGYAHSVEVWQEGALVGGLYGMSIGRIFFGESMFTKVPNASKFGFISLVLKLKEAGFYLIDCQQETPHLGSMGARPIPRKQFHRFIKKNDDALAGDIFKIPS